MCPRYVVIISEFTSSSVLATVNEEELKINNLGTDSFSYKCTCDVWRDYVKWNELPYCIHYQYVLAQLIFQGLIPKTRSKLSKLTDRGYEELESMVNEVAHSEKRIVQAKKEGKRVICTSCEHVESPKKIKIAKLNATKSGFIIKGLGRCPSCNEFLRVIRDVVINLEDLECPNCGKNNFSHSVTEAVETRDGYNFVVNLECNTKKCSWTRKINSVIQPVGSFVASIEELKITKGGVEIVRDTGKGLAMDAPSSVK